MLPLRILSFGIVLTLMIHSSVMADQQIPENNRKDSAPISQPLDMVPATLGTKKTQFKQLRTPTNGTISNNIFIYCDQSQTPCFDRFTSIASHQGAKRNQGATGLPVKSQELSKTIDWVTLITKLVSALAWPVTIFIIIVLLRKPLKELLPRLLKLKYKDLELSFDKELKEAIEKADTTALPKVDDLVVDSAIIEKRKRLFVLARNYPRAAILEAWLELEASIGNALYAQNITTKNERTSGKISYKNSAKILFENTPQYMSYFNSLLDLRNMAVHSGEDEFEIDNKKAVSFIELALRLVAYIDKQWPKK